MLGNTKWDTWEDSWNVAIMVSFCSELLKTKWNFEIEKLKFQYNLCLYCQVSCRIQVPWKIWKPAKCLQFYQRCSKKAFFRKTTFWYIKWKVPNLPSCYAKKKNTLVSGNASDKKNAHLGGRKFLFFLISLIEFFK